MSKLIALLIRTSRSPWRFALLAGLNALSLAVLFALEDRFEALTGLSVFDTQNGLTSVALVQQLPRYQGEALEAYLHFATFDFVFPFVAALFLAVTWALPLYAFLGTGFDYLENLSLLSVLVIDAPSAFAVDATILFKRLKLAALALSGALTGVLVVLAIASVRLVGWPRSGAGETSARGVQEGLK